MNISVAMATFNGQHYLREQLESVASQSRLPQEMVITDDSDDEETASIALDFAKTAPFEVYFYRNPRRLGSRMNFIRAISLCRNDIVAMCDQDDVWLPNKLERLTPHFADPEVMAAIHSVILADKQLRPLDEKPEHWHHSGVYEPLTTNPWYSPYGMSMLVRRSLFKWIDPSHMENFESSTMGHDRWAWFLASTFGKIVAVQERLAYYRQHESNLCGAPPPGYARVSLRLSKLTGAAHYRFCAERTTKLASVLSRLSQDAPIVIQKRAAAGIVYYTNLASYFSKRMAMYTSGSLADRGRLIGQIALSGGYKGDKNGGLGHKALIKDIFCSIMQGRKTGASGLK